MASACGEPYPSVAVVGTPSRTQHVDLVPVTLGPGWKPVDQLSSVGEMGQRLVVCRDGDRTVTGTEKVGKGSLGLAREFEMSCGHLRFGQAAFDEA